MIASSGFVVSRFAILYPVSSNSGTHHDRRPIKSSQ
jgi:hypothetical protein